MLGRIDRVWQAHTDCVRPGTHVKIGSFAHDEALHMYGLVVLVRLFRRHFIYKIVAAIPIGSQFLV